MKQFINDIEILVVKSVEFCHNKISIQLILLNHLLKLEKFYVENSSNWIKFRKNEQKMVGIPDTKRET